MLKYEIRKLAGHRFLAVLLCLLLAADAVFCLFGSGVEELSYETDETFYQNAAGLCARYNKDPADYAAYAKELRAKNEEHLASIPIEEQLGTPFEELLLKEIDGERPDWYYLDYVDRLLADEQNRRSVASLLCGQATSEMRRLREQGVTASDDVYMYEAYVYKCYNDLQNSEAGAIKPIYGWESFLTNRYAVVFLFAALILLASAIFLPEVSCGMLPILRACRYGRGKTARAKLATLTLLSVLLTLLFTAGELLAVYFKTGLSDPFVPLQRIGAFAAFPYQIDVFGYLFLMLAFRIGAAVVFAAFSALLSLVLRHPLLSLLGGAGLFGLNYLCLSLPGVRYPVLHALNLIALYTAEPISTRFYGFRLFRSVLPYLFFVPFLLLALFFAGCAGAVVLFGRMKDRQALPRLTALSRKPVELWNKLLTALRGRFYARKRKRKSKTHAHGLFFWESAKLYGNRLFAVLLLLLIAAQIAISYTSTSSYTPSPAYRAYNGAYLKDYEGVYTKEKEESVEALLLEAEELENKWRLRADGLIQMTPKEERDFQRAYDQVQKRATARAVLNAQYDYLKKTREEKGIDVWFLRYEPLTAICTSSFSLPLYIALLLGPILLFMKEYGGKNKGERFAAILGATKRGRRDTFGAKCAATALFASLSAVVFYGIDVLFLLTTYKVPLSSFSAPLVSLTAFADVDTALTVGQYCLIVLGTRLVSSVLLALFAGALAAIFKNLLLTGFLSFAVTGLPAVLSLFADSPARYIDALAFAGGSDYLRLSFVINLFNTDFGLFALFAVLAAALTALLALIARRKFVK